MKVERLFDIEAYRTLWHMTSTVAADAPGKSLAEIFAALFPCGSITGAPKGRAMQIIAELESAPRGLYTGALGYVAPGGDFRFNVPIRTLTLGADGTGSFAVGSGIVADSEPLAELAECRLKARFVTELDADFQLIETLSMQPVGRVPYPLLAIHLQRLAASARYFGFKCNVYGIRDALLGHSRACTSLTPMRTRLLVSKCGDFEIRSTPLEPLGGGGVPWVVWAERRIDSRDLFRRHKTTMRTEFDAEQHDWKEVPQVFDALFCNERGELCEGARCNVFVSIDGILRTPPLSSGVLDGVMRRQVFSDRSLAVVEQVLDPQHVAQADAIYVTNA
ncbi:MAG: chorismate-binding protein, partial [Deltaproteobacteria bacterium]|nr:chorismate-binding protein [Deltaproteobacteria bacterium]